MADLPNPKEHFHASDLDPEDLREIFDQIDENLAFWQVVYNDQARSRVEDLPIPDSPSLVTVEAASDWLKMSSAPLRTSSGVGGMRGIALRLLNMVVRLFEPAQIDFNRKLRDFLGELMVTMHGHSAQTAALKSVVIDLDKKVRSLEAANIACQEEINLLQEQLEELRGDLDRATEQRGNLGRARPV